MASLSYSPVRAVRLLDRHLVAKNTLAFEFERPPGFESKAGQFADITWIRPPETDGEGNSRAFSITSAPDDRRLTFATRLRDTAFKRVLCKAPLGTTASIGGPHGNLTLHSNISRPAVILAGGIGITPFRSIARNVAHQKIPHRIFLFYANRQREDAPFLEELWAIQNENANFTLVPTLTAMPAPPAAWRGEVGHITAGMIARHLHGLTGGENARRPIYYVAGPPAMVTGMREVLRRMSVSDDDIRTEEFIGY